MFTRPLEARWISLIKTEKLRKASRASEALPCHPFIHPTSAISFCLITFLHVAFREREDYEFCAQFIRRSTNTDVLGFWNPLHKRKILCWKLQTIDNSLMAVGKRKEREKSAKWTQAEGKNTREAAEKLPHEIQSKLKAWSLWGLF